MKRDKLNYTSAGYLRGRTPNGREVVAGHEKSGRTGFVLLWKGKKYSRYGQEQLVRDFGIRPHEKKSGEQIGYPSEPVLRAVWRHFVDRYNAGDQQVFYTRREPDQPRD